MGIGIKIKKLADSKKITLKELSRLSSISYDTLYAIVKRDNKTVKPELLIKLAMAFNMSYEDLLTVLYQENNVDFINKFYNGKITPDNITEEELGELVITVNSNDVIRKELEKEKYVRSRISENGMKYIDNPVDEGDLSPQIDILFNALANPQNGPLNYNGVELTTEEIIVMRSSIALALKDIKEREKNGE